MLRFIALSVVSVTLTGCGDFGGDKADPTLPPAHDYELTAPIPLSFYSEAESGLGYAATPTSATAKIFLVAGSLDNANFGEEIIRQKRLWLARGAAESDIACYFVVPPRDHFDGDKAQYQALSAELKTCRLAHMGAIAADMRAAAAANPSHVYLYVTSHGSMPLSVYAKAADDRETQDKYTWMIEHYPALDHYTISIDSVATGTASLRWQIDAIDHGANADTLFMTPLTLNDALGAFPAGTAKTVVLQSCYSGGFIDASVARDPRDSLGATPNLVALTAASAFRPSFGCDAGGETTSYGKAVLDSLAETTGLPDAIDWSAVYASVKGRVEALETAQSQKPSNPGFFSNR